jgi:hypothetical protein
LVDAGYGGEKRSAVGVEAHMSANSESSRATAMISVRTVARKSPLHAAMARSVAISREFDFDGGWQAALADMKTFRVDDAA